MDVTLKQHDGDLKAAKTGSRCQLPTALGTERGAWQAKRPAEASSQGWCGNLCTPCPLLAWRVTSHRCRHLGCAESLWRLTVHKTLADENGEVIGGSYGPVAEFN